ncbi:MAG TPA: hypothetical protein DCX89_01450 [Saprospirales bacterium]|nr:hypothetical protein [Saprospirales bacterium]HRQ30449.1 fibrobacter succinogenes major paralogous domain-containing protein [Saprospiraceae bacterium]
MNTLIRIISIFTLTAIFTSTVGAQISINTTGNAPDSSAIMDIYSLEKGVLLPRMTTVQQLSIKGPAVGLIVMNLDSLVFYYFDGTAWRSMSDPLKSIQGCGNVFEYGGKQYSTVQIGTQCWMKQNMNVGTRIDGINAQSNNGTIEKHCYNNVEDSCDVYGGLYQWNEMMQYSTIESSRGICPEGFHIPSSAEWNVLTNYLGGQDVAGGKMKHEGFRYWIEPNSGATNSSRFSGVGGGTYRPAGYNYFYLIRQAGIYWTSTTNGSNVWRRDSHYISAEFSPYSCEKYHSFSVRCVRD